MDKTIIYLDQNKWIDLSKSIYGKPGGEQFDSARDVILKKTDDEEWIIPLSVIHLMETESRLDDTSRKNLARVMSNVSKNYSILPYIYTKEFEIRNTLYDIHNKQKINIKDLVISKNSLHMVGLDATNIELELLGKTPDVINFLNLVMREHDLFYEFMSKDSDRKRITEMTKEDLDSVNEWEKIKQDIQKIPKEYRYKVFIGKNFMQAFGPILLKIMQELKVTKEELIPSITFLTPESTLKFLESIPSFDVKVKLSYAISNDMNRPPHKNDFKDIAFLATALPYCDVVVTEKSWAHHIKQAKLDVKYNTLVLSDLNELLKL